MTTRFAYRLGRRSKPILRLFGVRGPDDAWVELSEEVLVARFGRFETRTTVPNIVRWSIEGPWRWLTAIGVRRGLRHGDITFGGSHRGGVRLDVDEPFRVGPLRPRTLYVTVEDLEGLAEALAGKGIPGEDRRRR